MSETERAEAAEARVQYLDEEALRLQRAVDEAVRQRDEWRREVAEQRTRTNIAEAAATALRGQRDAAKTRAEKAEAELRKLESLHEDTCEETDKARDERDALEEALARARKQNADLIAAWKQGNARRDRLDTLSGGLQRSALEDALEQRTRAEQAEAALAELRGWYDEDTAMLQRILEAHDEDEAHDWIPDNLSRTVSEMRKSMRDRLFRREDAVLERAAGEQGDGEGGGNE